MNKLRIIGNLTNDPTTKTVQSATGPKTVCDFRVAVNDRNTATFFDCSAWGKTGEIIAQYMTKGSKIYLEGPVSARAYTAHNGETRAVMSIDVREFEFCGSASHPAAVAGPKDFVPVQDDLPWEG